MTGFASGGGRWLGDAARDVRYAVRSLARQPAFTVTVVVTLALGIGANAAIFSVVSGVILRPLPFAAPERLVQVHGSSPLRPRGDAIHNLDQYRALNTSFEALVGYEVSARYLRTATGADRLMAVQVEPGFFEMLGVRPIVGRVFGGGESPPVSGAVISEALWQRLGGDVSVLGQPLVLDDQTVTVLGVMPAGFQFPYSAASLLQGVASEARTDWVPFAQTAAPRTRMSHVTARLREGATLASAQGELNVLAARLAAERPDTHTGRGIYIVPLSDAAVSPSVRRPLVALFAVVTIILALACANVTNLSLARSAWQRRDIAVRSAIGAGRGRLVRQFPTESLCLAFAGGSVGLVLAWAGTSRVLMLAEGQVPRAHEVSLDWSVFGFLLITCLGSGLLSGLAPALVAMRASPHAVLQQAGSHGATAVGQRRLRNGLVVAEVALACLLAVGAAGLVGELARLRQVDPGMVMSNVVTLHVGHRMTPQTNPAQFYEIAGRVAAMPGVRAAGFIQMLPLQNWGWTSNSSDFRRRGQQADQAPFPIELRYVTPGYFEALGIPLRRGRTLTARDTRDAPPVIVINDALARRSFGGEDPVGVETTRGTIVGVVGDVRQTHLDEPALPEVYYPIAQNWSQVSELGLTLVVRGVERPDRAVDAVRSIVREVSPQLAIFGVKTMDRVVADSLADFTLFLVLMAGFAGLALVLATTGTYGVITYLASSRTREFARRAALGADRPSVTRLVLGEGLRLTGLGLACGITLTLRWRRS